LTNLFGELGECGALGFRSRVKRLAFAGAARTHRTVADLDEGRRASADPSVGNLPSYVQVGPARDANGFFHRHADASDSSPG
jgi:hypothetical protein